MPDKFSAVWVSHSSIADFRKCPRAYYLKNVYKRPETGRKMTIMTPALALGQAVHSAIESLSVIKTEERCQTPLMVRFSQAWDEVSGKKGGFSSLEQESQYKERGEAMIRRVQNTPGPVGRKAVKMSMELPHFWLSEEDGIILCGKVDWLEWLPEENQVQVIDFKTGKQEEDTNSLQLPIYRLLVTNCQKHEVKGAYYWYLQWSDDLTPKELPDMETAMEQVLMAAKEVKLARKLERYKCPTDGCRNCAPFEAILQGKAEFIGTNSYKTDVFILPRREFDATDSVIL